jgi:hypothetical protein
MPARAVPLPPGDALPPRGQIGALHGERGNGLGELPYKNALRAVTRHGRAPGERIPRHESQRVEISAPVDMVAGGLLGAHILGGAHHLAHAREACVFAHGGDCTGNAKIRNKRTSRGAPDHDVVGLDVAVYHPADVRKCQRIGDVLHEAYGASL